MKQMRILQALGHVDDSYIADAAPSGDARRMERRRFRPWHGAGAACLCLLALCTLLAVGANAHAMDRSESLLDVKTAPPEGLSISIDAAPDDAEFHIINNSTCAVTYGKASRVERRDGGTWMEVITERSGLFPSGNVTLQPGQEMYGMCGWTLRDLVLAPGSYRYLLVVEVMDPQQGLVPVVLRAEFQIR